MSENPNVAEQLERSSGQVTLHRAQVRKTLESPNGKSLVAIKQASIMSNELRTTKSPPQPYYELYNTCFDALSQLQEYLVEDHKNHHLTDVYEIVQYTATVLPRLYSMITVGTAFLATGDAPRQEVLKDMLEMSRGVQSPLRGLFLRYYLGQRTGAYLVTKTRRELEFSVQFTLTNFIEKNKLWVRYQHDGLSKEYDQRTEERKQLRTIVGSSILRLSQLDNLDLTFFSEHILPALLDQVVQCHDKLAQEYLLDVIVQVFPAEYHVETLNAFLGSLKYLNDDTSVPLILQASMTRISQYAIDSETERLESKKADSVKAKELKELEVDIANTDSHHKRLLGSPNSSVKASSDNQSVGNAVDQNKSDEQSNEHSNEDLAASDESPNVEEQADEKNQSRAESVSSKPESENQNSSSLDDTADKKTIDKTNEVSAKEPSEENLKTKVKNEASALFTSVVADYWKIISALKVSSGERAALIYHLLALSKATHVSLSLHDLFSYIVDVTTTGSVEMEKLLLSLSDSGIYSLSDTLGVLREFPTILASQSKDTRHKVAADVVNTFLSNKIRSASHVENNFGLATQVIELMGMLLSSGAFDPSKMRNFIASLKTDEIDYTLNLLTSTHTKMRKGGAVVVNKTGSILVLSALDLLRDGPSPAEVMRISKYCHQICHDLATIGNAPLPAFHLYLTCATAADGIGAEDAAYEMFAQASSIYEESITESSQQLITLMISIQVLQQCSVFTTENFDPLAQRCLQYSQKLMKKPDQCRTLLHAAHLYWDNSYADARKVEEVLNRALRSADTVMDIGTSVELFLDVLDANLYFLSNDTSTVTIGSVNNIIKLIQDNFKTAEKDGFTGDAKNERLIKDSHQRFGRTQDFVETQKSAFRRFESLEFNSESSQ